MEKKYLRGKDGKKKKRKTLTHKIKACLFVHLFLSREAMKCEKGRRERREKICQNVLVHQFPFILSHAHTLSFIRSSTLSFVHTFILSFVYKFIPLYAHTFVFIPLCVNTFMRSYFLAFIPACVHTFMRSYLHVFTPSCARSHCISAKRC